MTTTLVLPLLTGLIGGGAVNFVADTLPRTRRISRPVCGRCGAAYPWKAYVLGSACTNCGSKRGWRPWVVMVCMLALSALTWLRPHKMGFGLSMLLLTYFAVVVVVDVENRLILHATSIVGAMLALGIGIWLRGPVPTLLGGSAGLAIMLALYLLGLLFSKVRSRRLIAAGGTEDHEEALGAGDVILAGILGLVLGWPLIWFALLLGILLGGLLGLILVIAALVRGRYGTQAFMIFMPYGPAFVLSAAVILFLPHLIVTLVPK